MSETSTGRIGLWAAVLGIFSIALLGGIALSLVDVWRANRAMTWPTTNGIVLESRSAPGCGRQGSGYLPVVRYRYQVGSIGYESRRILFGAASCYSRNAASATVGQFPAAATVTVRFDPQAPAEAVLVAGKVDQSTRAGIYFMFFWFLLTAAATGMLIIVLRSKRRPSANLPVQRELGERR